MSASGGAMGLPTMASREDLAQIMSGKLIEEGRQPSNVQIVALDQQLRLEDADGTFLEANVEQSNSQHQAEAEGNVNESDVESGAGSMWQLDGGESRRELERVVAEKEELQAQLEEQEQEVQHQERYAQLWRLSCEQLQGFDKALADKTTEIDNLLGRIARLETGIQPLSTPMSPQSVQTSVAPPECMGVRKGKTSPVDSFSGDRQSLMFDDWLPTLERAAEWNGWTQPELLLQLAGHLRGRAFREWNLIPADDHKDDTAVKALRERVDPGHRTVAAQDFRHIRQREAETVADLNGRMERTFQLAYGMSLETRQMLLYGQLQEGLRDDIMKSPAVSGSLTYPSLCLAAKNEEQRQAELKKRQQY